MSQGFEHLFTPGKIGKLSLKNRVIMAPAATRLASLDGMVTDRTLEYYGVRASGGAAMIIVEVTIPDPTEPTLKITLCDDKYIPGLKRLADIIHQGGAAAGIQINPHAGRRDKYAPISAFKKVNEATGRETKVLDVDAIQQLVCRTGEGALRLKKAGFDLIMIHGNSGYLMQDFMSPLSNLRNDAYGGDFDRRLRFPLEVIRSVRSAVGQDFPVTYRLVGDERVPDGLHLQDTIRIAKILQNNGIDGIDITSGSIPADEWVVPSNYMPFALNTDLSAAMKANLNIPVSVAGRIKDPDMAENLLASGKADFIDVCRGMIADPFFVQKVKEGRLWDIRPCIGCLRCTETTVHEEPIQCAVNPAAGNEKRFQIVPEKQHRKVVVVGGGPGGMEAALVASQRGFHVTLLEATSRLGGQLDIGSKPPDKTELGLLARNMARQVAAAGINVKLNTKADAANILEEKPNAVIIASGALPVTPRIKGLDKVNKLYYDQVLSGAKTGQKIVVIGGGLIGCEVALFIHQQGKKDITILEMFDSIVTDALPRIRKLVKQKIEKASIKAITSVKDEEIEAAGVRLKDANGKEIFIPADTFVISCGSIPNIACNQELQGKVPQVFYIGDCVKARSILEAIHEGADAGLKL